MDGTESTAAGLAGSAGTGEIRALPALVVNQIAAGEVVERPASVVKELVDNAIDAGATHVRVELERGGIELVRVTDDGAGIAAGELNLAVHPHATSKIRETSDLDAIATMGFRGEALASIASVSRLEVRSRRRADETASRLTLEGAVSGEVREAAGPVGTRVSVRNLFFNTPARRKFLKTPATERGHALATAKDLAMSHAAIAFTISADGAVVVDLPAGQSARARAVSILGEELRDELLEVSIDAFDDERGIAAWGLIGTPPLARPTTKRQHVFLNGRPIRDKTVQHALREAYRGLVEPGRHPLAVLMIEMSPAAVDVNVHPTKSEVRFRDQSMVHRAVYRSVRDALRAADLTPGGGGDAGAGWRFEPAVRGGGGGVGEAGGVFGGGVDRPVGVDSGGVTPGGVTPGGFYDAKPVVSGAPSGDGGGGFGAGGGVPAGAGSGLDEHLRASRRPDVAGQSSMVSAVPAGRALQVHNSFLVTQDEQGLVIIDQHALHERVMFERLKERLGARGSLESQRLLMPAVVGVGDGLVDALEGCAGTLGRLGIEAEAAGPNAVSVSAFPTFLTEKGVEPGEFIGELLESAGAEGFAAGEEQALHEVLDMMACKAAVKAGDRLSSSELDELLAMRERVERSSNCPHGRPTAVRLTVKELERQFGR